MRKSNNPPSSGEVPIGQIVEWIRVLVAPDSAVEMRVIRNGGKTVNRYYTQVSFDQMARDAVKLNKTAKGVYFTLNTLSPDQSTPAKDVDIRRRRWMLIDFDPKRDTDNRERSSTASEKNLARRKMREVKEYLTERGWPGPVTADSGNGWHLLYRIDLPNDAASKSLVNNILKTLAKQFSDDAVDIDTKVGNAGRICKLYGTVAQKGDPSVERPHRVSRITKIPMKLIPLSRRQMDGIALAVESQPTPQRNLSSTSAFSQALSRVTLENARRYLRKCDPAISGANGHTTTLNTAQKLLGNFPRLTDDEAFQLMWEEWNPNCLPPWSEGDLRRKVAEARKTDTRPTVPVPTKSKQEAQPVPSKDKDGITSINLILLGSPPLGEAAYHGIAGDFIRAMEPYTEAVDVGILAHFLAAVGTLIGPGPHVWGGNEQPARINAAVVGPTSTGRKGTSFVPVDLLMKRIDPAFWAEQCVRGLSSGEGLIQKVSDERTKNEDGEWEIVPVEKRLCVVEPEFSRVLAQTRRDGNILSQVLRETYDSGNLSVLTRNPLHANNAHISIVGHITPEELKTRFSEIEMANGFGNRFLWLYVQSDKELPDAPPFPGKLMAKFASRLRGILKFAATQKRLAKDNDAQVLWKSVYSDLRRARPGLQGAMVARGESIVLRLALIYALFDQSNEIRTVHIEAALAVWQYNEDSVSALFKQKTGGSLTDRLYDLLGRGPMTTKEFYKHISVPAEKLREALQQLVAIGRVTTKKLPQRGARRPPEQWQRTDAKTA